MDVVQIFNDELQSLVDLKPPVSKAKMGQITRAAMKGVKLYKHIVLTVEKFVARCSPEYKVPGLYVIDSIVRQSRHQFGIDRDVYAARFARNLGITFENLFADCIPEDKQKIVRVLNLWQKNGVFNAHVIQPLLNMASPSASLQSGPKSPSSTDNNCLRQPKYNSHSYNDSSSAAGRPPRSSDGGLKFCKDMLDFDYDEDDDDDADETPTEAEPPLSSTLNKIEMEQRVKRMDKSSNNNVSYQSSQKSNPDQVHAKKQMNQDPVLERWNRIIRQQIDPNDSSSTNQHYISDTRVATRRSRSRSPPSSQSQSSYSHQSASTRTSSSYAAPKEMDRQSKDSNKETKASIEKSPAHDAERIKERERKCYPKIRDKHLTVCSSTLWLGHVPKTVSEADISDAFGEYGTINSIDLIPPRGCAYVCMDRRQDAKRALNESRDLKLNGSHIKMAWAPGKGFKEYKKLKDFWEADVGASFIPYSKIDDTIDFDTLEEGGVIDEDSMSLEMRERRDKAANGGAKESSQDTKLVSQGVSSITGLNIPPPGLPMLSQPPPPTSIQPFTIPPPNLSMPPPVALGQGLIPFPPPGIVTTASSASQMLAPHLPPVSVQSMTTHEAQKDFDQTDGSSESPLSIDQQLSMTERQISMVEQQLTMIQQSQGMGQAQPLALNQTMPPQAALFYQQNQPNPMMFDMPPPVSQAHQLLHGSQPMLDPQQMAMFMNHPLHMMGGGPPIMPVSQAGMMDPNEMNVMGQHHGHF